MEKRLLWFLVLLFAWLYLFNVFFAPKREPQEETGKGDSQVSAPETPAKPDVEPPPVTPTVATENDEEAKQVETLHLAGGVFDLEFSNQGAMLTKARVQGFSKRLGLNDEEMKDPDNWVAVVDTGKDAPLLRPSLGLETLTRARAPYADALRQDRLQDAMERYGTLQLEAAKWNHAWLGRKEGQVVVLPADAPTTERVGIRFTVRKGGLDFTKDVLLPTWGEDYTRYDLTVRLSVAVASGSVAAFQEAPPLFLRFTAASGLYTSQDSFYRDPIVIRAYREDGGDDIASDYKEAKPDEVLHGIFEGMGSADRLSFFGAFNKHFVQAATPQEGALPYIFQTGYETHLVETWESNHRALEVPENARNYGAQGFALLRVPASTTPVTMEFELYVGPKDQKVFRTIDRYAHLEAILDQYDFGNFALYRWFFAAPVGKLLISVLDGLTGLVGNVGFAIILLTLLVRSLLFPINRRQQVSMAVYQQQVKELEPEIKRLKEKYKADPRKLNQKQFELMKKNGVSVPFGGCLTALVQMPIFLGLFASLRGSILLRHQPFLAWIRDLSRPDELMSFERTQILFFTVDALNLLPIIMIITWIWHQRSMPKPNDPQQQTMMKVMSFMMIFFGIFLYNYASGLALYMITSSSLGIVETRFIKKKWPLDKAVENLKIKRRERMQKLEQMRTRMRELEKRNKKKGIITPGGR